MPAAKDKTDAYINTSEANIYTEGGRCGPKQTVELTAEQAKGYKGLELASSYKEPEPEEEAKG